MNKGKHCEGNFNETKSCNIARCPSKFCINFFTVLRLTTKIAKKYEFGPFPESSVT